MSKDKNIINNKRHIIMAKLNFTAEQLIDGINFSESDYVKTAKNYGANATFDEFIQGTMGVCEDCNGTLDDAIEIAENAYNAIC